MPDNDDVEDAVEETPQARLVRLWPDPDVRADVLYEFMLDQRDD